MMIIRDEIRCWSLNQHLLVVNWYKMLIFDKTNSKSVERFCRFFSDLVDFFGGKLI